MLLMSVSKIQNITLSHQFKFNFSATSWEFRSKVSLKEGIYKYEYYVFFMIKLFLITALKLKVLNYEDSSLSFKGIFALGKVKLSSVTRSTSKKV